MTQRTGFVLRVKPDRVDEYVRAHREVWPEMLAALQAAGIRNYTIFRAGEQALAGRDGRPARERVPETRARRRSRRSSASTEPRPPRA